MFPAKPNLQIWFYPSCLLNCQFDQSSHSLLIQNLERIRFQDLFLPIRAQKLSGIISGESKNRLSEIVGTKEKKSDSAAI